MTRTMMFLLMVGFAACSGDGDGKAGDDDDGPVGDDDDDDTTGDDDDDGGFDPVGTWSVYEMQQQDGTTSYTTSGTTYNQTGYTTYDYQAGSGVILIDFLDDGTFTFDTYYTQSTTTTTGTPPDSATWEVTGDTLLGLVFFDGESSEWRCSTSAPYDEMSCEIWAGFQYDAGGRKIAIAYMERT